MFRHIHKNIVLYGLMGLITLILACGSSGGGDDGGGAKPLATGTFIKADDDAFSSSWSIRPEIRYQTLLLADDINGSGFVDRIAFKRSDTSTEIVNCPNFTIKMGHTSRSALTDTYASNVEEGRGSMVTTLDAQAVIVPAGAETEDFEIELDTPFNYNGVDNLVVELIKTQVCDRVQKITSGTDVAYNGLLYTYGANASTATTGFLDASHLNVKLHFAGGDDAVFTGPGLIDSVPFGSPGGIRQQQLYLASDINGSGPITGLGIQAGALTTAQTYTATVKLGHATVPTLASDYTANYSGTPIIVANAVTFNVPAGVPDGSYVWIPLTGSFDYNGTDNLILEIDVSTATGDTPWRYSDPGSGDVRLINGPSDASSIIPVSGVIHHVKFRFNGGTMDVIVYNGDGQIFPFYNTAGALQHLYHASQLGSAGKITRIECRAYFAATETGISYSINLAHATIMDLNTNFANNLQSDAVEVYNGTFDIPSMLVGDWFGIDLTTPFNYDGTSNLVMEIRGTGGSPGGFACSRNGYGMPNDQTLWNGSDEAATTGITEASLIDTRFYINK